MSVPPIDSFLMNEPTAVRPADILSVMNDLDETPSLASRDLELLET